MPESGDFSISGLPAIVEYMDILCEVGPYAVPAATEAAADVLRATARARAAAHPAWADDLVDTIGVFPDGKDFVLTSLDRPEGAWLAEFGDGSHQAAPVLSTSLLAAQVPMERAMQAVFDELGGEGPV